jgi:hypothetical protein
METAGAAGRRRSGGLIGRYGRSNMEEVFLDIARGTGKGAALANSPA